MKSVFTADDFDLGFRLNSVDIAAIANAKLAQIIESWPVVYGTADTHCLSNLTLSKEKYSTHVGRLAFIEELPKEPCKHEPEVYRNTYNNTGPQYIIDADHARCKHCDTELVATWTPK